MDKVVSNATEVVDRRIAVAAATEAELLQADEHGEGPKRDMPLQVGVVAENHYTAVGFVYGSLWIVSIYGYDPPLEEYSSYASEISASRTHKDSVTISQESLQSIQIINLPEDG